jgi:hypothetical protein
MRDTLTMALVRAELYRAQTAYRRRPLAVRQKVCIRTVIGRALRSIEVLGRRVCHAEAGVRFRRMATSETSSPPD